MLDSLFYRFFKHFLLEGSLFYYFYLYIKNVKFKQKKPLDFNFDLKFVFLEKFRILLENETKKREQIEKTREQERLGRIKAEKVKIFSLFFTS